jgi:excinuclease ABC subunit A
VDGYIKDLKDELVLIKTNKHTIEVEIDRISLTLSSLKDKIYEDNLKSRLTESIQQALNLSAGNVVLAQVLDSGFEMPEFPKKFSDHLFSEKFSCPVDNIQLPEIEPRTFSFNSPHGACPSCSGIGKILKVDPALVFSDQLSITEGGILPLGATFEHDTWFSRLILTVCKEKGIDARKPTSLLTQAEKDIILYGTALEEFRVEGTNRFGRLTQIWENFEGIVHFLERRHRETESDYVRWEIERYMRQKVCEACHGTRLKKEALAITIGGVSIAEMTSFSINKAEDWIKTLEAKNILDQREKEIARLIIKEILTRLQFLKSVGLEYLTIDREAGTLSGGEAQRIRLASQIGSGLTGVLYVLDEPTIGLHQKDNQKLIDTLKKLRDLGNSVIVVEHDREMLTQSDHVIDFGPGAGKWGGTIVASGTPSQLMKNKKSLTGQYLSGKKKVEAKNLTPVKETNGSVKLLGCSQFNLKNIDVEFPLGKFIVISGVSGSGKSTLLVETLYPAIYQKLNPYFRGETGAHKSVEGDEAVDKIILIDQSPIGRTPRSNPATYTKAFDPIRDVFAASHEAKVRGFNKGHFSFNVRGGRCEACEGQGQIKIEMQFMSDIWINCEVCHGLRYNSQTLEVFYKGKNIADVLQMTVGEALEFFHAHSQIQSKLMTLSEVGLGYMHLGQPATTLSGGEAQRVKLASELSKKATGRTFYILDEPTTGLHFADVENLLKVLRVLVGRGNTVCVIEHNLDVIKNSDWIIDMGPEGGAAGGRVIAQGTVKDLAKAKNSYTGEFLRKL